MQDEIPSYDALAEASPEQLFIAYHRVKEASESHATQAKQHHVQHVYLEQLQDEILVRLAFLERKPIDLAEEREKRRPTPLPVPPENVRHLSDYN